MAELTKSIFQILDELNQQDCKDNKGRVKVSLDCLGGDNSKKNGTIIKIRAPDGSLKDMAFNKRIFMLVSVDRAEYSKLEKSSEINQGADQ